MKILRNSDGCFRLREAGFVLIAAALLRLEMPEKPVGRRNRCLPLATQRDGRRFMGAPHESFRQNSRRSARANGGNGDYSGYRQPMVAGFAPSVTGVKLHRQS
jgi:hypothetical protein